MLPSATAAQCHHDWWHDGRADDVIISAGWTMSAKEIEDTLLAHPDVEEAAAIAVADDEKIVVRITRGDEMTALDGENRELRARGLRGGHPAVGFCRDPVRGPDCQGCTSTASSGHLPGNRDLGL